MNELIFGKDTTERIVSVEPGKGDKCTLFIQDEQGNVTPKEVSQSHWLIYTEQHSPKMRRLDGDQPYKWIMEYDNASKYNEILDLSRKKRMEYFNIRDPKEAFMVKNGVTMYKGMKAKDIGVLSFDLEHTFGIGNTLNKNGKLLLISITYRDELGEITKLLLSYDEFKTEAEMLDTFCIYVRQLDPSIVVGHNIFGHDFKILQYAANRAKIKLTLGRDSSPLVFDKKKSFKRKDGSQSYEYFNVRCYGREIIDTYFLVLTYDVKRMFESYGLKQIMKQSGLEKKDRAHYDASKIHKNYMKPNEWAKIKEYAKDDADDALAVFDLMGSGYFLTAQAIPRSFQQIINTASGSQINSILVRSYLQQGHSIAKASEKQDFRGAYSFGVAGIHENVFKIDIQSEHPSLILSYEIQDKKKDPHGNFLKLVKYFVDARLITKAKAKASKKQEDIDQDDANKVFLNSFFGALGTKSLNYNYPPGGEMICRLSREILAKAIEFVTGREFSATEYGLKEENIEMELDDVA